jgi:hypothetical protein
MCHTRAASPDPPQVSPRLRAEEAPKPSTGAQVERVLEVVAYLSSGREAPGAGTFIEKSVVPRKQCLTCDCEPLAHAVSRVVSRIEGDE